MMDIGTTLALAATSCAASKVKQDIVRQLKSFADSGKAEEEVNKQRGILIETILQILEVIQQEYNNRTGHDFEDSSEEEVLRFQLTLARAWYEVADEFDPERIKILAAGVVGTTWGDIDKELRSAAWKAIRRLEPTGVRLLCIYSNPNPPTVAQPNERDLYKDPNWLAHLEGLGCIHTTFVLNDFLTQTGSPITRKSMTPVPKTEITEIGRAVLKILKDYSNTQSQTVRA